MSPLPPPAPPLLRVVDDRPAPEPGRPERPAARAPRPELERLRAAVRRIEGAGWADRRAPAHPLGLDAIDAHLPWGGLPEGALHEVLAADPGRASAFAAVLAARLAAGADATVLWCEGPRTLDAGALYPPGLLRFGLDPGRLVLARTGRDAETLWAMEEGLRCRALAAVVGAVSEASLAETRRLQLAAEASGVAALMLRPAAVGIRPSAAVTRWRVGAAPGSPDGDVFSLAPPRWRLELVRCRGGAPGAWDVEWRDETRDLAVAAPLRDRAAPPPRLRAAGG